MNRFNSELPKVELPEEPKRSWFTVYHLWGYAFLALAFLLAIGFIYQMEYGRKPSENKICVQVVTTARSPYSGETRDFPTPCDVPEGWEVVPGVYNEIPNIQIENNDGSEEVSRGDDTEKNDRINQDIVELDNKIKSLAPGDQVLGMTVQYVKQLLNRSSGEISVDNAEIGFTGPVTVTGEYEYYDSSTAFFAGNVCFRIPLSQQAISVFPLTPVEADINWFCFVDDASKVAFLPVGSKGVATVIIDNYVARFCGCEAFSTAQLVSVIEKK